MDAEWPRPGKAQSWSAEMSRSWSLELPLPTSHPCPAPRWGAMVQGVRRTGAGETWAGSPPEQGLKAPPPLPLQNAKNADGNSSPPHHHQSQGCWGKISLRRREDMEDSVDSSYLWAERSPRDRQPWARLTNAQRPKGGCFRIRWVCIGLC